MSQARVRAVEAPRMHESDPPSLSTLVRVYQRKHGPRLKEYLCYFRRLDSLADSIRFACHGKEGRIHPHQYRVGKQRLEQARTALLRHADEIESCRSFGELLARVAKHTRGIDRFGILAVYDTSLRLGAHLNRWPDVVYLHAGTKKGCKALNVDTSLSTVEMENLPKPLRLLEPYQAEDFLCIFKARFVDLAGKVKGC